MSDVTRALRAASGLTVLALAAACSAHPPAAPAAAAVPAPSPSAAPAPPPALVPWHDPVPVVFVHQLVMRPALAFTDDVLGRGFRDFGVTVPEMRRLLDQLWLRGRTLVDLHRVVTGTVRVPQGRTPVVLVEDDANYYDYARERGQAWRLVLDSGEVRVKDHGADGRRARVSDDDLVPLVEAAVAQHPLLSADGARGVLAVTGYQGVLGERLTDAASRARAVALVAALRSNGWSFASHTYGHVHLGRASRRAVLHDAARWDEVVGPVVGPTDVLVYPYGDRPPPSVAGALAARGFRVQMDIDVRERVEQHDGWVLVSRRHVDGLALQAHHLDDLVDVRVVRG